MVISIPVSSFSQKIITREHGAGIIQLNRSTGRLGELLRVEKELTDYSSSLLQRLSSSVQIETKDRLARHLHNRRYTIGLTIHRFHMDQLIRFMWSLALGGTPAMQALRMFYELYEIGEDDLAQETAYRQYERWRKSFDEKKQTKNGTHRADNVVSNCRVLRSAGGGKAIVPESVIHDKCIALRQSAEECRLPQTTIRQAQIFLYHSHGVNVKDIAKKFARHPRKIYEAINKAKNFLQYDHTFNQVVTPHLSGVLPHQP